MILDELGKWPVRGGLIQYYFENTQNLHTKIFHRSNVCKKILEFQDGHDGETK